VTPNPSTLGVVRSIQIGQVAPLGPDAVPSAFIKRPVEGEAFVDTLGIAGDAQADHRVHGGRDKAVYSYAFSNYRTWHQEFAQYAALLVPGCFGENLTVEGCDEHGVCVGDALRVGEAVLQVTEPRQPCYKFALRFGDVAMPRAMIRNGLCGWYCRVVTTGRISGAGADARCAAPSGVADLAGQPPDRPTPRDARGTGGIRGDRRGAARIRIAKHVSRSKLCVTSSIDRAALGP
jgi:MOSC domain-containing protein YiiM